MNLTSLALALAAVLAMFALTASAASANYQSSSSPVSLTGFQNGKHVFKVDGQAVECNVATFNRNSLGTPSSDISLIVASYSNCTAFGFASANVTMGTCTYNLDPTTAGPRATVDLACNSNANDTYNPMNPNTNNGDARIFSSVFGSECEVHVQTFNNASHVNFLNNTPVAGDVRVGAEVIALTAEKPKDNGLCPLSGTGFTNNATYNGNLDVTGSGSINLTVN